MKTFEEYQQEGIVKNIRPDNERAKSFLEEARRKLEILSLKKEKLGINDTLANDYVEDCYNTILFCIRAKMLEQGFTSSGKGAHEAEVAFALKIGFSQNDCIILDQLRYFRNGILYYGKRFDEEYANTIISFTHKVCKEHFKLP